MKCMTEIQKPSLSSFSCQRKSWHYLSAKLIIFSRMNQLCLLSFVFSICLFFTSTPYHITEHKSSSWKIFVSPLCFLSTWNIAYFNFSLELTIPSLPFNLCMSKTMTLLHLESRCIQARASLICCSVTFRLICSWTWQSVSGGFPRIFGTVSHNSSETLVSFFHFFTKKILSFNTSCILLCPSAHHLHFFASSSILSSWQFTFCVTIHWF